MALRVFNTLTHEKEQFEPVEAGKVGMYLCGPTVYKESHIGHAVGPVIFDAIKRYLVFKGFQVHWVVNITDVEDKIMAEAARQGRDVMELAESVARLYREALGRLGVKTIDSMPKASEHIGEIIEMCETLIAKDYAYAVGGDVYFSVTQDEDYGKLSNRNLEDQSGQRDLVGEDKRHPGDFALWKAAKKGEPEAMIFDSPWGPGRPGWHIECSAMSVKYLGETFDFHGGGMDLIFPHHENEIAQSESCSGKTFARYWLHHGLTRLNTKKVSKSDPEMAAALGKLTLSNLLNEYTGEELRFFILSTQYRRPIDFSDEELSSKRKGLDSFYRLFERVERIAGCSPYEEGPNLNKTRLEAVDAESHGIIEQIQAMRTEFMDTMDDDFNTAGALGVLFRASTAINRYMDERQVENTNQEQARDVALMATRTLIADARVLGLFETPIETEATGSDELTSKLLDLIVQWRLDARKDKQFALADRIRDELDGIGVGLEDHGGGTRWRIG
jgi:cysteinyl-tRNA synthetase